MGCGASSAALPIGTLPEPKENNMASIEYWESSPLFLEKAFAKYSNYENDQADSDSVFMNKEGVTNLAIDCISAWHDSARKQLKKEHPSWSLQHIDYEIYHLYRPKYFNFSPLPSTQDLIAEARLYLLSELRYQSPAGVSRAMFHLNFARAYKVHQN